jgi:hypothetical protein
MKKLYLSGEKSVGLFALVDDEDYESLSKHHWNITTNGYAKRCIFSKKKRINKTILMHQEILNTPDWIDHKNMNKLDNQKDNLRICDASTNGINTKISSKNTSGYRGVHFANDIKRWRASIHLNRKRIWLGVFKTAEEASIAYNLAAKKYFGEFARINI